MEKKKRKEKIEQILTRQVAGESFILSSSREWKRIVLQHFNQIQRKEITVDKLLQILKSKGIQFSQKDSLVKYPVQECLRYIAKVSNIEITFSEEE